MTQKFKYSVLAGLLCIIFASGIYFFLPKQRNYPTFSVNQKFVGQALTNEEQHLFNKISEHNNQFLGTLDATEIDLFNSIKNKVISVVNKNPKIKIKYKKLLTKDEQKIVTLVRKYRKEIKKNNPVDKKIYASMMKKLTSDQSMELYLYIK